MPANPVPWRSVWFAFVIAIPALAIALLSTLFAVSNTDPRYDTIVWLDGSVVGGAHDTVVALGWATGFGAIGIFSFLNLRTRLKEWRRDAPTRHRRSPS
jgi:hypothetical protein